MPLVPSPHRRLLRASPRAGVALVLTLSFLALLSVLILAFFSSVRTESQSARTYSQGVSVKQLVDAAQNIVIGQITDATLSTKTARTPRDTSAIPDSQRLTWASQPGMIRTWDTSGTWQAFKLYSSAKMVLDLNGQPYHSAGDPANPEVPLTWASQPALLTDLNSPVTALDQNLQPQQYYPIIDPRAVADKIDGFRLDPVPGGGAKSNNGATPNPAAMPVQWIYVLKDGTLTTPASAQDNGATASWAGSTSAPTKDNPIVGRVAFWTDDETCKLNINTASEATPWDTPRALCKTDLQLGLYQPYNREYQRYPGHPFNISLSPVFFPGMRPDQPGTNIPNYVKLAEKEKIYALIPRVKGGGSAAATSNTNGQITPDADRLYASPDELAYVDSARKTNSMLTPDRLKRAGFFLTTDSRSPELTAFGTPRISMWPVDTDPNKRTAFDRLSLFCTTLSNATVGNSIYSVQRHDPFSQTNDYQGIRRNQDLYHYLQTLTSRAVPGFGGTSFAAKWGVDRDQVLTEIIDYIRCTNLRDPNYDTTSQNNYTYDPAGALLKASGQVAPLSIVESDTKGFGRFHSISQFGFHFICSQQGAQGAITAQDKTKTLGPDERIIQAAFLMEPFSPSLGFFRLSEDMYFDVTFQGAFTLDGQDLKMRSGGKALVNGIGQGYHNNGREHGGSGGVRGPVGASFGAGNYQWQGQADTTQFSGKASSSTGVYGVKVSTAGGKNTMSFSGGTIVVKLYCGATTANPPVQTFTIGFPGGNFPIPDLVTTGTEGYRDNAGSNAPTTQEEWWTLAGFTVTPPAPAKPVTYSGRYARALDVPHAPGAEYANPARRWDVSGNGSGGGKPGFKRGELFRREDVVRSVVPDHGDMRLVAASKTVGGGNQSAQFVKVRSDIWDSQYRFLHIFHNNSGPHFMYGFSNEPVPNNGQLTANKFDIAPAQPTDQLTADASINYHYARLPEIRPGAGKQYNHFGDFDNGPAQWVDGAYINKPDEGSESYTNSVAGVNYDYWSWNDSIDFTSKFFSPNRVIPSPGMLGSLPVGVKRNLPWTTLLFRPQVSGTAKHPGLSVPVDHQIMDLFWMPVVEPYAISEPFSTNGKVNMNYEIAPFTYIRRTTALHGAFKGEMPMVIPNAAAPAYKLWDHESNDNGIMPDSTRDQDKYVAQLWAKAFAGNAPFDRVRLPIDLESNGSMSTIQQFDDKFKSGDIFRSATQICEVHLVRLGETLTQYRNNQIWPKAALTGDNTRERPYTNLYGKLTTKSNAYTVHIRAQVLRKAGGATLTAGDWQTWKEGKDLIESEYRGSSLVERYLESTDPNLVDFATTPSAVLDTSYRVRIVSSKKFAP